MVCSAWRYRCWRRLTSCGEERSEARDGLLHSLVIVRRGDGGGGGEWCCCTVNDGDGKYAGFVFFSFS